MKFGNIVTAVTSGLGRKALVVQKYSPTILFVAGTVGVVATVVLASRATLQLDLILDEHEANKQKADNALESPTVEYTETDHKKDVIILQVRLVKELAKLYGPALVMGIASIAALTGSHVMLNRRGVALMAAYAAVEKGFGEYRKRVIDQLGEEKDRELRYGLIDKEIFEDNDEGGVVQLIKNLGEKKTDSPYAVFFDENSTSWSREHMYNQTFLICQQNYANDKLRARGHLFLNEVYDMLGLPHTKAGAVVGWLISDCGDGYVDFGIFRGDVYMGQEFVNGNERSVLLDFNVDGVIYDKI